MLLVEIHCRTLPWQPFAPDRERDSRGRVGWVGLVGVGWGGFSGGRESRGSMVRVGRVRVG